MSIRIMTRVWDARGIGESGRRLVLLKLADCANDAGERAFPSVATIAADCELGRATVFRALAWLQREGWIEQVVKATHHRPAEYRICLDATGQRIARDAVQGSQDETSPATSSGVSSTTSGVSRTQRRGLTSDDPDYVPRSVNDPSVPERAIATRVDVASDAPTHPVKALLTEHDRLFRHYVGQTPHYTGKDAKLAKALIDQHGYEDVVRTMELMFTSLDPFIRQSGRDIAILSSCWNKLRVQAQPQAVLSESTTKTLSAGARWLAKQAALVEEKR